MGNMRWSIEMELGMAKTAHIALPRSLALMMGPQKLCENIAC